MDKRTILAIALSLLVLLAWSAIAPKTQPIASKEVTTKTLVLEQGRAEPATYLQTEPKIPDSSLFDYNQTNFTITFIEPQAAIKEITFKNHQNYKFKLENGFLLSDPSLSFQKESATSDTITFVHKDQNKKITKKFIFSKSSYAVELEINVQTESSLDIKPNLSLILGRLDFSMSNLESRYQDIVVGTQEKTNHFNGHKELNFSEMKFLALREKYFCAIIEPAYSTTTESTIDTRTAFIRKLNPQKSETGITLPNIFLTPKQNVTKKFHIYLGPQELRMINSVNPNWAGLVNYGTFDIISQILLQLLNFFHNIVHNWGWAIIILSLVTYLILFPFTLKQMRSMKEMQMLQPKIEELRKTYKDNPQRLNKETLELYREHKVNPLGGCLPLLLQLPIFMALYNALMRLVSLKGANFLWIKDLSEPDKLFTVKWLPTTFPVISNEINLLPILMTIGMFVQQKISTVPTSGSSAEQQKIMMIVFPLMFGFIFYRMPSGLVLYWFINSALMLLYQIRAKKTVKT